MKYFSLFSGVGGFEIGITNAYAFHLLDGEPTKRYGESNPPVEGIQRTEKSLLPLSGTSSFIGERNRGEILCLGFSELDRYASDVLRYHYPETKNYGDITKIQWDTVPDFDLLVGGSPCQSFSIAGKRAGFNGASGLFWEYLRCLKEKKPSYFIWENVKGVLSSNHGYDFANIVNSFSEAGYALWWQVLNAKNFGVPQNRERIFVVGARNGSPREVFFERQGGAGDSDGGVVAGTVTSRYPASQREGAYIEETRHGEGTDGKAPIILHQNQSGTVTPHEIGVAQGANRSHNYQTLLQGPRIRRLTPTECERLMSWPDGWTRYGRKEDGTVYEMSDTQRYKMCGNGVVSKVVEELIKQHLL